MRYVWSAAKVFFTVSCFTISQCSYTFLHCGCMFTMGCLEKGGPHETVTSCDNEKKKK